MSVMMIKSKIRYLKPQFLWEPGAAYSNNKVIPPINEKEPELNKEFPMCLATKPVDVLTALENRISDWSKMVRIVALVIKFMEILFFYISYHKESKKFSSV